MPASIAKVAPPVHGDACKHSYRNDTSQPEILLVEVDPDLLAIRARFLAGANYIVAAVNCHNAIYNLPSSATR
jgi:hypothetical protein